MKLNKWICALVFALCLTLCAGAAVADALSELTAAFANGGTYELSANVVLSNGLTLPADKTLELDLKGHSISMEIECSAHFAMITNRGTLIIKDSVGGGKISFKDTGSGDPDNGWGSYTLRNEGTLTLENGAIENTSGIPGHAGYAIDIHGGTVTIDGGSVYSKDNTAIRLFGVGTLTINDGEVTGKRAVWLQLPNSDPAKTPTVTLNVNGGTLTSTDKTNDLAVYSYSYGNSMANVTINITGGKLDGDLGLTGGKNKDVIETVNISGGDFTNVYSYSTEDEKTQKAITITGGKFDDNTYVEWYSADDGNTIVKTEDGHYIVGSAPASVPTYSAPRTGDNSQILLWAGLMIVSVLGMMAAKKRVAER